MNTSDRIAQGETAEVPFRYARWDRLLPDNLSQKALAYIREEANWIRKDAEHYRSDVRHLDIGALPPGLAEVLNDDVRSRIRYAVEETFGVVFEPDYYLMVNRYHPGDGTEVHTDWVDRGNRGEYYFTHRLIWYLNGDWTEECGGLLGLFSGPSRRDLCEVIPPVHNSAVAITTSPSSYHAVSESRGMRYAIIFSFVAQEPAK